MKNGGNSKNGHTIHFACSNLNGCDHLKRMISVQCAIHGGSLLSYPMVHGDRGGPTWASHINSHLISYKDFILDHGSIIIHTRTKIHTHTGVCAHIHTNTSKVLYNAGPALTASPYGPALCRGWAHLPVTQTVSWSEHHVWVMDQKSSLAYNSDHMIKVLLPIPYEWSVMFLTLVVHLLLANYHMARRLKCRCLCGHMGSGKWVEIAISSIDARPTGCMGWVTEKYTPPVSNANRYENASIPGWDCLLPMHVFFFFSNDNYMCICVV
jgi:hypothetical protein